MCADFRAWVCDWKRQIKRAEDRSETLLAVRGEENCIAVFTASSERGNKHAFLHCEVLNMSQRSWNCQRHKRTHKHDDLKRKKTVDVRANAVRNWDMTGRLVWVCVAWPTHWNCQGRKTANTEQKNMHSEDMGSVSELCVSSFQVLLCPTLPRSHSGKSCLIFYSILIITSMFSIDSLVNTVILITAAQHCGVTLSNQNSFVLIGRSTKFHRLALKEVHET